MSKNNENINKHRYVNQKEIEHWLREHNVQNWTIIEDENWKYIVNVEGDVLIDDLNLDCIPFKFGQVKGNFNVSNNDMKNLIGSPDYVGGNYLCYASKLESLEGVTQKIGGGILIVSKTI